MNDFVYIVNVVDESGSMFSIKDDAIGGYNNFIEDQKKHNLSSNRNNNNENNSNLMTTKYR